MNDMKAEEVDCRLDVRYVRERAHHGFNIMEKEDIGCACSRTTVCLCFAVASGCRDDEYETMIDEAERVSWSSPCGCPGTSLDSALIKCRVH